MSTETRRLLGPFNRVEGDVEVELEIRESRVASARVSPPLFRGFERILEGRPPLDALAIVPRICGICSISQSMAAAAALRTLSGVEEPLAGRLSSRIAHAVENVVDHLSHFYLFFMPDFARAVYSGRAWHPEAKERFGAETGSGTASMLPARARLLHVVGILAGKWPHTLAIQPGGTTKAIDRGERQRMRSAVRDFRRFVEHDLFGGPAEELLAARSAADLDAWTHEHPRSDLSRFSSYAQDLGLEDVGRSGARFSSVGAYDLPEGPFFEAGLFDASTRRLTGVDMDRVVEDPSHSWMAGGPAQPFDGRTDPDFDRADGYSLCKAPRLDGEPLEVGALARQLVDAQPLVRDFAFRRGVGVTARVLARVVEIARCLVGLEAWIDRLEPDAPVHRELELPKVGRAAGLVEAARGTLGHWIVVENGLISRYQIISPTTWNFSPRDAQGRPGPLEAALEGVAIEREQETPVAVQHIVRSFDPCMACTVH